MGYHKREIPTRGVFGKTSKVREELEELEEAIEQGCKILALCEMSDLYGALEGVAETYGVTMTDIAQMSALTKSAFLDGTRRGKGS